MSRPKRMFVVALPILLALGCSSFVRPLPYTLVTASGTSLRVYTVNTSSGALSEVSGSPVTIATPSALHVSPDLGFAVSTSTLTDTLTVVPLSSRTGSPATKSATTINSISNACISRDSLSILTTDGASTTAISALGRSGSISAPSTTVGFDSYHCLTDIQGRGFLLTATGTSTHFFRVSSSGIAAMTSNYTTTSAQGPLAQSASGSDVVISSVAGLDLLSFDGSSLTYRSSLSTPVPDILTRVGNLYAATSLGATIRFYRISGSTLVLEGTHTHSSAITSLSSDPSGTFLAVGDSGGVTIYRATSAPSLTSVATKSFGATTYAVIGYGDPRTGN